MAKREVIPGSASSDNKARLICGWHLHTEVEFVNIAVGLLILHPYQLGSLISLYCDSSLYSQIIISTGAARTATLLENPVYGR